jgi:ParB-like chromosome segregation protein Spo0J
VLVDADSPRLGGEDPAHIEMLAQSGDELPPILVHRPTMQVIDGMHRVKAAVLRGAATVDVEFFDGTAEAAFLISVKLNMRHGLPLSPADRTAAATRIMQSWPNWSDRRIGAVAGLSANTVGALRRATGDGGQLHARVGRDGRVRPVSTEAGRRLAGKLIVERPNASLREIAVEAGISPGTVRDVRQRVARGDDPVPGGKRPQARSTRQAASPRAPVDPASAIQSLAKDPSLRLTNTGRDLLQLLGGRRIGKNDWAELVDCVPPHCTGTVASLARSYMAQWQEFANALEKESGQRSA